jgi:hypothetical protein
MGALLEPKASWGSISEGAAWGAGAGGAADTSAGGTLLLIAKPSKTRAVAPVKIARRFTTCLQQN